MAPSLCPRFSRQEFVKGWQLDPNLPDGGRVRDVRLRRDRRLHHLPFHGRGRPRREPSADDRPDTRQRVHPPDRASVLHQRRLFGGRTLELEEDTRDDPGLRTRLLPHADQGLLPRVLQGGRVHRPHKRPPPRADGVLHVLRPGRHIRHVLRPQQPRLGRNYEEPDIHRSSG